MERQAVYSSEIKSIGYENGILEIEFINGSISQYSVSTSVYHGLIGALCHEEYFNSQIRNRYAETKIKK